MRLTLKQWITLSSIILVVIWKTSEQAREEYEMIDSESKRSELLKSKYLSVVRDLAGKTLAIIGQRMDTHSYRKSYMIISSVLYLKQSVLEMYHLNQILACLSTSISTN